MHLLRNRTLASVAWAGESLVVAGFTVPARDWFSAASATINNVALVDGISVIFGYLTNNVQLVRLLLQGGSNSPPGATLYV